MRPPLALAVALLFVCRIGYGHKYCDNNGWLDGIAASCSTNQTEYAEDLIRNASLCLDGSEEQERPEVLRVFTSFGLLLPTLQVASELFYQGHNNNITIISGPSDTFSWLNASVELTRDVLSYYDGFITDAEALPELAELGVVAPLDSLIMQEPGLKWFRISRYYRGFAALYDKQTYGVPLGGVGISTFYRRDVFERLGIQVPTTWDELLATAQRWSGKIDNGDGTTMYPFCMKHGTVCGKTLLLSIAAPYLQNTGPSAGVLIDPRDGGLLVGSTAFLEAMRIWQLLKDLGPPADAAECTAGPDHFANGSCLLTVQPFEMFKTYAYSTSLVRDKLGVAPPPGSSSVLDRTSGELEQCSPSLCPMATYQVQQAESQAEDDSWPRVLVNNAPFMWAGLVGMVNSRNPRHIQEDLVRFFADVSANMGLRNVLAPFSYIAPFRTDHYSAAAQEDWTDAGYDATAVTAMRAVVKQLYASPNLAPPLRLRGWVEISTLLDQALDSLAAGQAPAEAAAALQQRMQAVLDQQYGRFENGTPRYLDLYRQQLGYMDAVHVAAVVPPPPPRSSGVSGQTVVVIAVVIGLVALLGAVVALEVRNKRRHKDLLGRVKPPLGDPDTTIVVASIQDFDDLWEALISDASERALQQFSDLVDLLLRRHSGYRAPSEEEDVVVAFHCPRDACQFSLELQRGLQELRWPKHVLEMEQFRPQYLAQTKRASFSQSYNGSRVPLSPLAGRDPPIPTEDDDKLFSLDTNAENVRSFGEQCVASWTGADSTTPDAELVFCGIRARVGVCAVGFSRLALEVEPGHRRYTFSGEAVEVATAAAVAAQGGMVLIPQSTFRQLHLEVLAEQCLFCHLGEYQLTAELPPMDLYLALDRQLLGRLALFGPLSCHMQWSQGAFAAPVHSASMVFTHVVGVQTLLAWDYDLMQDVIETFTKLAQVELQQAGGYLVEHVEGFMLTAFHSPADAILWGLRMQELMLKEDWPEELLAHELCEEVTVTVPVRGGEVTSATVFRGPRLKTGIDIGQVLARLHTMTGRMTYRGKVMNRAARISAAASSGQVLCSSEAWESCTASASALRLVTATSLGLFQLKGIQERIEVFHCTYQRHVASSTRRSSTVSVGVVSSSDNRRKSALVLSSLSHISHHTTSYRTSHHNSTALEHVSASDAAGRRGSTASSAAHMGQGSMGGAEVLNIVGMDQANGATGFTGTVLGSTASPARYRMLLTGDVAPGAAGASGAPGQAMSQTSHNSQRSQGSGGGGGLTARAALAAVLQSRTRSASAIHVHANAPPFRSTSARSRRPPGQMAVASEPQVTLASAVHPAGQPMYFATSPSALPSLAIAAAAAASCERANSPKTAATLDVPGGTTSNGTLSSQPHHHHIHMAMGGHHDDTAAPSVTAALYAVLPSVVLSSNLATSPVNSGFSLMGAMNEGRGGPSARSGVAGQPAALCVPDAGASDSGGAAKDVPPCDVQTATITVSVGDLLVENHTSNGARSEYAANDSGGKSGRSSPSLGRQLQPPPPLSRQPLQRQQPQQQPLHLRRMLLPHLHHEHQPPAAHRLSVDDDESSRVETLEVSISATGLVRGVLSGAGSSAGLGAALGFSQSHSISRCGSATAGISHLALGPSGGMGSSPGSAAGGGAGTGGGSHGSSCASSGFGGHAYTHSQLTRGQSAAGAHSSLSVSPLLGAHYLAAAAGAGHSGSANRVDLFLPFPMGVGSAGGPNSNSTSSDITATAAVLANIAACTGAGSGLVCQQGQKKTDAVATAAAAATAAMSLAARQSSSPHNRRVSAMTAAAETAMEVPAAAAAAAAAAAGFTELTAARVLARRPDTVIADAASVAMTAAAPPPRPALTPSDDHGRAANGDPANRSLSLTAAAAAAAVQDNSGSSATSSFGRPDSRSNSVTTAVASASVARREDSSLHGGAGGGGGGSCRLRSNRAGSSISNDLASHAASPSSTWISGCSTGSTLTMPGATSASSIAASGMGVGVGAQQPASSSLRLLLAGVRVGEDGGVAGSPAAAGSGSGRNSQEDDASPAGAAGGAAAHRLRSVGRPLGAVDNAAMAAAFGIEPPCNEYAATAAACGVGPPVGDYGGGGDGGHVGGPTPEQLEMALELLGESRHAAGGGWH